MKTVFCLNQIESDFNKSLAKKEFAEIKFVFKILNMHV